MSGSRTSRTSRRKPCGVWASARSSRGIVPSIQQCDPSRATCFTVSCTRRAGDRCALARSGVDDPADDRAGHERTRRIVHEHDVRVAWQRGDACRHRILPPRAASHHVQQLRAGRCPTASVRACSTSPSGTTTTMPRTRGDAAHAATLRSKMVRSPIDSHCLATAPTEAPPLATSGDDHVHDHDRCSMRVVRYTAMRNAARPILAVMLTILLLGRGAGHGGAPGRRRSARTRLVDGSGADVRRHAT